MKTGELGIKLIKYYEGLHDGNLSVIGLQPKECPAGIWTVGYGLALKDKDGSWLKGKEGFNKIKILYPEYTTITPEQASILLIKELEPYEAKINSLKLDLLQHEFDALVSFIYNLGFGALQQSTLLKRIISKSGDIKAAFLMWNKCGGKILLGLTKRRETESELFLTNKLIW